MNSIIFYSFIFAAFIVVVHADLRLERLALKEMMKDVRNLIKMHKHADTEFRTPENEVKITFKLFAIESQQLLLGVLNVDQSQLRESYNLALETDNLSCYMAELKGRNSDNITKKLMIKAKQLNLSNIDCPNRENYKKKSSEQFLKQLFEKLQKKFHAAARLVI